MIQAGLSLTVEKEAELLLAAILELRAMRGRLAKVTPDDLAIVLRAIRSNYPAAALNAALWDPEPGTAADAGLHERVLTPEVLAKIDATMPPGPPIEVRRVVTTEGPILVVGPLPPAGIEAAWATAEAALPDGWVLDGLRRLYVDGDPRGGWLARATDPAHPASTSIDGADPALPLIKADAPTPDGALLALATALGSNQ